MKYLFLLLLTFSLGAAESRFYPSLIKLRQPVLGASFKGNDQLLVDTVFQQTTSAAMGMKSGDLVLAAGKEESSMTPLATVKQLQDFMKTLKIGDQTFVKVLREQKEVLLSGKIKNTLVKGLVGQKAPQWQCSEWFQAEKAPVLKDYEGKVLLIYCFQHGCPWCHKLGFPTCKKLMEKYKEDDNVKFLFIQTAFEGHKRNTFARAKKDIIKYGIKAPFGQDKQINGRPFTMSTYRNNGTPWFILINAKGEVVFNDFQAKGNSADECMKSMSEMIETSR